MTQILTSTWQRLLSIKKMASHCSSTSVTGWNGKGEGQVVVTQVSEAAIIFEETGIWKSAHGLELNFKNSFRWSFCKSFLALEHLRFGMNRPVFLFNLTPAGPTSLQSECAHLCGEDAYFATLDNEESQIQLKWRVAGPNKNEEIATHYW